MANPAFQSELIFQGEDTKKCLGLRHGDTDPVFLKIIRRGDGEGFSQGKNKLAVQAETGRGDDNTTSWCLNPCPSTSSRYSLTRGLIPHSTGTDESQFKAGGYIAEPKVTGALPTSARTMDQEEELNGQNTANGYSQLC